MDIFHPGMKFQLGSPSWNFYDYIGIFIPGWKFKNHDFNENYFLNKWNFLFSSWNETKVMIIWRKMMLHDERFNVGLASRDDISSRDEIFNFLHVIVICFLYWKQWQGKMKFQLSCVIIISSRGNLPYNQPRSIEPFHVTGLFQQPSLYIPLSINPKNIIKTCDFRMFSWGNRKNTVAWNGST